jgi:CBS domain-containing protein
VRVRDVMSSPVVCVPPDRRLKDAADLLVTHGISAMPVVDDGDLAGIVSEADLLPLELAPDPRAHLGALPEPPQQVRQVVAEVMTRQVVALPEDADTAEAARLMLERHIKSIPIVRGRRVVGIVARRDLLQLLARSDEDISRDLDVLLAKELGQPSPYRATVHDGIVRLIGLTDPISRRLAVLLVRGVPGVVAVQLDEE